MGERRLRAAAAAGLQRIPAIIRSTADDAMLRDALLENIHRSQLNPLEEAAAYQQLLEEFGTTHDELAQRLGRSRPQVIEHDPAAELARPGATPGGCRRAVGRPCAGAAQPRGRGRPGRVGRPDRRRGPVRACDRGARCARPVGRRPEAGAPRSAAQDHRPGGGRTGRQALRRPRHPGTRRARPPQGPDHRGVRVDRRPRAHRRRDGAATRPRLAPGHERTALRRWRPTARSATQPNEP